MDQLAQNPVKLMGFILIMASIAVFYGMWFNRKSVEFKRMHHKRISLIFIGIVCGVTYAFFPSDKNMVLLILGALLFYLINTRLVHYCAVCGKTIRTNMIKQVPEQCPYCHSLYTPPGKLV